MKKFIVLAVLFLSGCGYSFLSEVNTLPVKTVWVRTFANMSNDANAGDIITSAITNKLITNKSLKLTAKNKAGSILSGKVNSISNSHIAFDKDGKATRDRVIISVSFKLKEGSKKIRGKDDMIEFEDYDSEGSPSAVNNNKQGAINKAAGKMANDIIDMLFLNF